MTGAIVKIEITPAGARELEKVKNADKKFRRGIRKAFFKYGEALIKNAVREILIGKKSGKTYTIRGARGVRRHVSSGPGESHAEISGRLRKSIGYKVKGARNIDFGYGVNNTRPAPKYGRYLELGTRKIHPRPTLGNAVKATERDRESFIKEEIKREFE